MSRTNVIGCYEEFIRKRISCSVLTQVWEFSDIQNIRIKRRPHIEVCKPYQRGMLKVGIFEYARLYI